MGLSIGDKQIKGVFVGDKPVKAIYLGDKKVWPVLQGINGLNSDNFVRLNQAMYGSVSFTYAAVVDGGRYGPLVAGLVEAIKLDQDFDMSFGFSGASRTSSTYVGLGYIDENLKGQERFCVKNKDTTNGTYRCYVQNGTLKDDNSTITDIYTPYKTAITLEKRGSQARWVIAGVATSWLPIDINTNKKITFIVSTYRASNYIYDFSLKYL